MRHYIEGTTKEVDLPSEQFFAEIEAVCKKYEVTIGHQDYHGAFVIEEYDDYNLNWLRNANFTSEAADIIKRPF